MGLERGLDILELIAAAEAPLSFTTITERLGLTNAVASRLLKALVSRDLITRDSETRNYRRGPGIMRLTKGMEWAPNSRKALAYACERQLWNLVGTFDQSFMCLHWDGKALQCLVATIPDEGIAMWSVGTRTTLIFETSLAWPILSVRRERFAQGIASMNTEAAEAFAQADAQLRERGWCEQRGKYCQRFMSPVFCSGDQIIGVLACFANPLAISDYSPNELGNALLESAVMTSRRLGWDGHLPNSADSLSEQDPP